MTVTLAGVWFVAGLVALIVGAELLVRGASRLAALARISPLVIGLTVVAFGTSSPELAVSVKSALAGQSSIALGNVIGSNIFNVLAILGVSALIVPLSVSRQLIRFDVPAMIAVSILALGMGWDGRIGRIDGALLAGGLGVYIWFSVVESRREAAADPLASAVAAGPVRWTGRLVNLGLVLLGLLLLGFGSRWLVDAAVFFARAFGMSELVVGLTIVAMGTSLPEAVTSVVAALRGERDIAVGNVVGSNLFNILGVLGIAALVAPAGIAVAPAVLRFDLPVMIAVAVACLPIFFTGSRISRWEGALFVGYFCAYMAYLVMSASQHEALDEFNLVMLFFILPLTAVTLLVVAFRSRA